MQKKDIIELGATLGLVFILIFMVANIFKRTRSGAPGKTGLVPAGIDLRLRLPGKNNVGFEKLLEETRNLKLKRDPFMPGPAGYTQETSVQGLVLTGIVWNKENPVAIINDSLVKPGDSIGANKVVEIKPDRVILNDGGSEILLTLD